VQALVQHNNQSSLLSSNIRAAPQSQRHGLFFVYNGRRDTTDFNYGRRALVHREIPRLFDF
jgi:hypothetical protein